MILDQMILILMSGVQNWPSSGNWNNWKYEQTVKIDKLIEACSFCHRNYPISISIVRNDSFRRTYTYLHGAARIAGLQSTRAPLPSRSQLIYLELVIFLGWIVTAIEIHLFYRSVAASPDFGHYSFGTHTKIIISFVKETIVGIKRGGQPSLKLGTSNYFIRE